MVTGTGPGGQIRAGDVENFVPSAVPSAPTPPQVSEPVQPAYTDIPLGVAGQSYVDIPMSNMRKVSGFCKFLFMFCT